jgi:5-methylcytosine-specific restriction protein A
MMQASLRPCPSAGCRGLWDGRTCTVCGDVLRAMGRRAANRRRQGQCAPWYAVAQRWYHSARWRLARLAFLRRHPQCAACLTRDVHEPATIVDHLIAHRGDGALFWNEANWQALCKPCHDAKTRTEG